MNNKRIVLEISEELHDKLKKIAAKDRRTVNNVVRIFLEEFIDIAIDSKMDCTRPHKTIGEHEPHFSIHKYDYEKLRRIGEALYKDSENEAEIQIHGSILTTHQRGWLHMNPFSTLDDYKQIFTKNVDNYVKLLSKD